MDEKIVKPEFETRYVNVTMRALTVGEEKKPVIAGTAAVYDAEAVIAGFFREKIARGAFDRVLMEKPDVIGAPNHDWNQVLGRTTAGTLRLEDTQKGLNYEIDINSEDQDAMNLYARVKRGDISQSSFAFTVRTEEWTKPANPKDLPLRTVREVDQLFDVSPVTFPAYPQTSAAVRSRFANIAENELESEPEDQAASGGAEGASPDQTKARAESRRRWIELTQLN